MSLADDRFDGLFGDPEHGHEASRPTVLEPALWARLADVAGFQPFGVAWLTLQCGMIGEARAGIVVLAQGQRLVPASVWPEDHNPADLMVAAAHAFEQNRGVAHQASASGAAALAYPIVIDGAVSGVTAVELRAGGSTDLRGAMRALQWGTAWVRERLYREKSDTTAARETRASAALRTLAIALEEERFLAAARAVVTDLALQHGCERVSLGFLRRGRVAVAAISHSARFGKQMNLVRMLGEAMDEAVDQRAILAFPPPGDEVNVTRAHEQLLRAHGATTILTVPLFVRDRFIGAFTFEWPTAEKLDANRVAVLDAVASAAGPILDEKRQNDRFLLVKTAGSVWVQAKRLLGPGHIVRKLAVVAIGALACAAYFAVGTYRVSADAVVEGEVQRTVAAPFNSYIMDAPARAGDTVKAGQILASLDDKDLVLERLKWVTERQRKVFEYEKALGDRNRADQNIASTEIEEAEAQVKLLDEQLAHAKITAPFDGIVISGDLTQSIGAAVQRGQVLFEIAPLDTYRVALDVDETQIADVTLGQAGRLIVASLPAEPLALSVSKITPVSKAHDGRNTFRVEATIAEAAPHVRPGMRGTAKIDIDRRHLAWIWTRTLLNWLSLSAWRWFG